MTKKKVTKKEGLKDRVSKVDDRTKVLAKKYPFVFAAVLLAGAIIGFALGAWLV